MGLAIDIAGRGDPLVLVHGLATTRSVWRLAAPLLARTRRVVALDVPGFGESDPVGPGFELDDVADAIRDGLRAAGVEEPYELAGHSMGAAVALTLAAREPAAVRALVLVAPAGLKPVSGLVASGLGALVATYVPARRAAAPLASLPWGRRLLTAGLADGAALPAAEVRALLAASSGAQRTRQALVAVAAADLRGQLELLPLPVGSVWGEGDRVIPPGGAQTLLALRPGAACEVLARAGHMAMVEQPEAFVDALERVLAALR